ncbi:MAG TPA: site-2 protease family protein [Solirubrobacteraceae bacterium]|nr:site-2 protease family protein [Solirubrobacteraceae bacterium]
MSYVLAFVGFAALIILHEAGHFAAAKAVGMRVERFSLFFGPLLLKTRRGETEYGIGPIPLGGYVKITGMNPNEEIPEEIRPRAYYNQAVWKRIVVILAGPVVNLVIAFVIFWILLLSHGEVGGTTRTVQAVLARTPAAEVLRPGDTLVSVDGVRGSAETLRARIGAHRCAGPPVAGCRSATPMTLVVRRRGQLLTLQVRAAYSASARRMQLGFAFGAQILHPGAVSAAGTTVSDLASVTARTVSTIVRVFQPAERRQLHGVVGGYETTQQSFATSTSRAFEVLALISLSLGVINLFPFLPLDGGHIFWALAEKVRGRRIPFAVMERAGFVGFVLIIMLFFVGLSNDISALGSGGLTAR